MLASSGASFKRRWDRHHADMSAPERFAQPLKTPAFAGVTVGRPAPVPHRAVRHFNHRTPCGSPLPMSEHPWSGRTMPATPDLRTSTPSPERRRRHEHAPHHRHDAPQAPPSCTTTRRLRDTDAPPPRRARGDSAPRRAALAPRATENSWKSAIPSARHPRQRLNFLNLSPKTIPAMEPA